MRDKTADKQIGGLFAGKMKGVAAVCLFAAMVFSGCILTVEDTGETQEEDNSGAFETYNELTDDSRQLAANRNVAYLHAQTQSPQCRWINAIKEDSDSGSEFSPIDERTDLGFTLTSGPWGVAEDPPLDRTIKLDENEKFVCRMEIEFYINVPLEIPGIDPVNTVSFWISVTHPDGSGEASGKVELQYERDNVYEFEIENLWSEFSEGDKVFFMMRWDPVIPDSNSVEIIVHTDGPSRITMPITSPIYIENLAEFSGEDSEGSGDSDLGNSADGERNPDVEESEVSTSMDSNGQWHATKTITITNDFGGASKCDLALKSVNGHVDTAGWGEEGYKILANLEGRGYTEEEARNNLEALDVVHADDLGGSRLTLSTEIKNNEGDWNNKQASIDAYMPSAPSFGITSKTTNGHVEISGLHGETFSAETTNGHIEVDDAYGAKFVAHTTNGHIESTADFDSLDLQSTNGHIEVDIASKSSGEYDILTTNGHIELTLENTGGYGYDLTADNSNAEIRIDLSNTEQVGEQSDYHKHVRTTGYDAKEIQISARLETTNAHIYVEEG